jgi:tetratricopeptide (TPR) repeat protein
MKLSIKTILIFIFMPVMALAGEVSLHQSGVEAFKAGKYEQALEYFQKLESEGVQTPTLSYNLGSTYYMLRKYRQAEVAFQRLLDNPDWAHLALYNLGLIAEAEKNRDAAIAFYTKAFDQAGESRVKQLSAIKLESLQQEIDDRAAARKWHGMVTGSVGYDDNPALVEDNVYEDIQDDGDIFFEFSAFASRYLNGDYHDGLYLLGGAYARFYADADEFNFGAIYAGISRHRQYLAWHTRAGILVNGGFIENSHYVTTPTFQLTVQRNFNRYRVRFDNNLSWIEATDTYDYLTGIQNRFTAEIMRRMNLADIYFGYRFEYNNRNDLHFNDAFFSYSPLRNEVYAEADVYIAPKWTLSIGGGYRKSHFPDTNWIIFENGSGFRQKREDDRLVATIRAARAIGRDFDIFAEYGYTDNDSNFAAYSYRSNQILLGLKKLF